MVSGLEKRISALEDKYTSESQGPSVIIIKCQSARLDAVEDYSPISRYSFHGQEVNRLDGESEESFTERATLAAKEFLNSSLALPVLMASTENMLMETSK